MIKTLQIEGGDEIRLSSSAAFLYIYQNQFKEDPFDKLFKMMADIENLNKKALSGLELMRHIDLLFLSNLTWALAKNADSKIEEPIKFYQKNSKFRPLDHIEEILDMAIDSLTTSEKVKN